MHLISIYVWQVHVQFGNSFWTKAYICHFILGSKSPHVGRRCEYATRAGFYCHHSPLVAAWHCLPLSARRLGENGSLMLAIVNKAKCRAKLVFSWKYNIPLVIIIIIENFLEHHSCYQILVLYIRVSIKITLWIKPWWLNKMLNCWLE